jgi:hypothetical protein
VTNYRHVSAGTALCPVNTRHGYVPKRSSTRAPNGLTPNVHRLLATSPRGFVDPVIGRSMTSDRRPCCEDLIAPHGRIRGPSVFGEAQRRWTLRADDDLVLRLNDVSMAEGNRVADAYPPAMINAPPSRAPGER